MLSELEELKARTGALEALCKEQAAALNERNCALSLLQERTDALAVLCKEQATNNAEEDEIRDDFCKTFSRNYEFEHYEKGSFYEKGPLWTSCIQICRIPQDDDPNDATLTFADGTLMVSGGYIQIPPFTSTFCDKYFLKQKKQKGHSIDSTFLIYHHVVGKENSECKMGVISGDYWSSNYIQITIDHTIEPVTGAHVRSTLHVTEIDEPVLMSDQLADFLSKPKGTTINRAEVTHELNAYIRVNKLLDPAKKFYIIPDTKLKKLLNFRSADKLTITNLKDDIKHHFKPVL